MTGSVSRGIPNRSKDLIAMSRCFRDGWDGIGCAVMITVTAGCGSACPFNSGGMGTPPSREEAGIMVSTILWEYSCWRKSAIDMPIRKASE